MCQIKIHIFEDLLPAMFRKLYSLICKNIYKAEKLGDITLFKGLDSQVFSQSQIPQNIM